MERKESKKGLFLGVIFVWIVAIGLYYLMRYLDPILREKGNLLFDFTTWITNAVTDPLYKVFWAIGDFTEGTVHRTLIGSLGLILFGFIAHWINKTHPEKKLYGISVDTSNFPWVVLAATSGLLVSSFCYDGFLVNGWMPTFLPGCTIPAALVIMYGGGLRVSLTGGILCGFIQFPCSYLALIISEKVGMPSLVFVTVLGMSIGGIIVVEIFRLLPWTRGYATGKISPSVPGYGENKRLVPVESTSSWIFRRTIADPTEVFFFGSEIAGIGLILGGVISWILCPGHNSYGVPMLFPAILCAQLMGSSLCALVYYNKWKALGFYPTYTIAICVGVLLLTFGTTLPLMLIAVLLGTFIIPPCAAAAMNFVVKHMSRYPAMVGSVSGMGFGLAVCTLIMKGIVATGVLS